MKNASLAQSPLILIGGATTTLLKGRGSLQDIDQQALFAPHVKWQASVTAVRDIVPTIEKAFLVAQSGVPGPVFLEFPIDVIYPEMFIRKEAEGKIKGPGIVPTIARWYIGRHLGNLYGGKELPVAPRRQLPEAPLASEGQISSALAMIAQAKKPVLVLGSQTVVRNERVFDVQAAVGSLGLPIYLSGMARGLLGKNHPLHMRHKRGNALKESDLVILIGVPFDFRLGYGQEFSASVKTLCVNLDKSDLSKNRTPTLAILADPCKPLLFSNCPSPRLTDCLGYSQLLAPPLKESPKGAAAQDQPLCLDRQAEDPRRRP